MNEFTELSVRAKAEDFSLLTSSTAEQPWQPSAVLLLHRESIISCVFKI